MPIDEVRWGSVTRVHHPVLLLIAALAFAGLVVLLLTQKSDSGPPLGDSARTLAFYLIETIVGTAAGYILSRRVEAALGGEVSLSSTRPLHLGVTLWGGPKQRADALAFISAAESHAMKARARSRRRARTAFARAMADVVPPEIPANVGGEGDERLRELAVRVGAVVALQLLGFVVGALLPTDQPVVAAEPPDASGVRGISVGDPPEPPPRSPVRHGAAPQAIRAPSAAAEPVTETTAHPGPMAPKPVEAAPAVVKAAVPEGMVLVPAGTFTMGSDTGKDTEKPVRTISISHPFFVDRTEVTARQYGSCVNSGACTPASIHGPAATEKSIEEQSHFCTGEDPERSEFPINCIDLAQADAYCTSVGKRLPTEAEWEYAARGADGRTYPWGESYGGCGQAVVGGCMKGPVAVGSRPGGASPWGALDMAGNVWEWVSDGWDPSPADHAGAVDPRIPRNKSVGVLRGGSWDFSSPYARTSSRLKFSAASGHVSTGVRCARDAG